MTLSTIKQNLTLVVAVVLVSLLLALSAFAASARFDTAAASGAAIACADGSGNQCGGG